MHTVSLGPGLTLWYDLSNKKDMIFGTWNVGSLYRAGPLTAPTRELAGYKLDLVGMQEVRWDKGGTVRAGYIIFSIEKETKIDSWEQDFLYVMEYYQQLR
jgi:hypothetical protein